MRSKSNRRWSIACRPSDASIFESHPSRSGSWREYIVHRHTTRYSPWCACVWCVLCDSQVFLLPVLNLSITLSIHIALCHHDHLCVCHCCRHSITASSEFCHAVWPKFPTAKHSVQNVERICMAQHQNDRNIWSFFWDGSLLVLHIY